MPCALDLFFKSAIFFKHVKVLAILSNSRIFFYSDSEFGKSEMHSLKKCTKRILITKMDQETSNYIMKHIDNLSTRTSRPLPVSVVAHQSDDSYESTFNAFKMEIEAVILKFAQLWKKNATLAIADNYHLTPMSSAARFAANNKSPQIISLYRKNKALHFAVKNNWLTKAHFLLESGADINVKDVSGNSPLHIAVDINSVEMVKLLLSYHGNPSVAIPENADTIIIGRALHLAVAKNLPELVEVLLNAGADTNKTNCNGETALHLAAATHTLSFNRLLIVNLLIKKGANPNVIDNRGRTVLYNALFNMAEDVAKLLLEMDCAIEVVNQQEFETGLTPLHLAAWHKYENITTMLLAKEAKVDIKERNGLTPLEYAAALNAVNVAERLLEADAEGISRNQVKNIRSPLHVAAAYDALEVGVLFISKGADIHSIDGLCLTPLHYAAYRKSTRFIEFLKATQENWLDVSASDERHQRKPKLKRNKEKINRKRLFRPRRHQPEIRRKRQPPNQQQYHTMPNLSKNLSPDELASIPQLIDCFKVISSDIPKFPINNPSSVTSFVTVKQQQVINLDPGHGKSMGEGDSFSKFEVLAK
jgi:ankyrin repeat protein